MRLWPEIDDRITCAGDCANYRPGNFSCSVQKNGEFPRGTIPDIKRRCPDFTPLKDSPDQRSGAVRWPNLAAEINHGS